MTSDPHAALLVIVGARHGDRSSAPTLAEEPDQVSVGISRQEALIIEASLQRKDVSIHFPSERTRIGVGPIVYDGSGRYGLSRLLP